ncbi:MSMEG_4193 family putative phosphomutase [Granulicoccus phenolivorans]|uniref:MSMEG_4193 family putative phosphomutase n=1 Tax=Granulicoccus phenolivorans TaxID=266854 RepID=UPI0004135D27|nr:MSMEG_4193 family putative phosphomutase [Granulicoccus phenolivorans]
MTTLFLLRHGRSTANTAGVLAGRTPGVALDETGIAQARGVGRRLAEVPLVAALTSPIQRCLETTGLVLADRAVPVREEPGLAECDYGEWTGRTLKELAGEELWKTVQRHPSAAVFPGGESMPQMYARAVTAVREAERGIRSEHGDNAAWLAVSHGDVIKSILADALGLHLDNFQRIMVEPASLSVINYTPQATFVVTMNQTDGKPTDWIPKQETGDAVVGGGTGKQV